MAFKASGFGGTSRLHDVTAGTGLLCDLCGDEVDSEVADAVALDCSFAQCDPESSCYHTHCLEKFLKSMKCERNRKIGFPCPRGCGKGSKFKEACRGKILKSHPVTIRSEANKKRRQAELDQLAQVSAARKKEAETKVSASKEKAAAAAKDKGKGKAAAKPAAIKALNVANTSITNAAPPKTQAQLQKEQLAAAAKNLKSQILARSGSSGAAAAAASSSAASKLAAGGSSGRLSAAGSVGGAAKKEVKTLDEYLAERTGSSAALERSSSVASSSAAPAASAWGRSRANSASSLEASELAAEAATAAAAPLPSPPQPPAAPQLPQLSSEEAFPPPLVAAGRPPRPPPPSAAPAPAAAMAPVPGPATVQPQGVWAQKPAAAVVATPAPPPPPPRAAAPAAQAQPAKVAAAAAAAAQVLPGLDDSKLSRTQRKNQKRAEKKAAAAAAAAEREVASPASPETASPSHASSAPTSPVAAFGDAGGAGFEAAAGGSGLEEGLERCMQALVQHKLQGQVEALTGLGFPPASALAAVQQHGGNLEGALVTLLEQATGVQDGHGLGSAPSAVAPPEVDLTEELQLMQELQARYGLPSGSVEALVVEHQGDLDSLVASLAQQQQAPLGSYDSSAKQQQQQQQQHGSAQQQATGRQSLLQPEPLSPATAAATAAAAGGLFGALGGTGVGGEPTYSLDSWGASAGGAATASLDSAGSSAAAGCYSAFGFGGFAEAALHAVHGGVQAGVLGGVGTPTSRDHAAPAVPLGGGIWSTTSTAAASPHGSALAAAAGDGPPAYGSDSHLLSLLGVSDTTAAATSGGDSSSFGLLGSFDALQPSSSQPGFDQRASAASTAFSTASGLQPAQQLGGGSRWQSSEGQQAPRVQQPGFAGLPAAASLWGAAG